MHTGRDEGVEPGVVRYSARPARLCIWDNRISEPRANGERCADCDRVINDKYLGTVNIDHIQPICAVSVWIEQVSTWHIVEVAPNEKL